MNHDVSSHPPSVYLPPETFHKLAFDLKSHISNRCSMLLTPGSLIAHRSLLTDPDPRVPTPRFSKAYLIL